MGQDYAFVIMPFTNEMDEVYSVVIKPAVEDSGHLSCLRAAEISPSILRGIVEGIRDATVVIAELTGKNANVFYELGIAHALGNNVIMLTQDVDEVPFNVRPYKIISYSRTLTGANTLGHELRREIATLRQWSTGPTNPVQDFLPTSRRSAHGNDMASLEAMLRARTEQLEQVRREAAAAQQELESLRRAMPAPVVSQERTNEPRIVMRPVRAYPPEERIRFRKVGAAPA